MGTTSSMHRVSWVVGFGMFVLGACGPSGTDTGRPADPFNPNAGGSGANGGKDAGPSTDAEPLDIKFADALAMTGGTGGGGGEDPPTDALMACGTTAFRLERTPPEVLIVLDRSGSMMRTSDNKNPMNPDDMVPPGTPIRWRYTYDALRSVMDKHDANIAWGLKMFPTCTPGAALYQCDPNSCHTEGGLTLPEVEQAAALSTTILRSAPRLDTGATPMAPAIDEAVAVLQSRKSNGRPKYILLATDGVPNCGVDAVTMTRKDSVADGPGAVASVKAAKAAGFDVFVLGIGFMDPMLNSLAQEGGRPRPGDTKYFSANDEASFKTALDEIAAATVSCTLPLGREPPPDAQVRVDAEENKDLDKDGRLDTAQVPMSATDGWSWGSAERKSLSLNGSYCMKLKSGQLTKTIVSFGCPNKPIPPPPVAL